MRVDQPRDDAGGAPDSQPSAPNSPSTDIQPSAPHTPWPLPIAPGVTPDMAQSPQVPLPPGHAPAAGYGPPELAPWTQGSGSTLVWPPAYGWPAPPPYPSSPPYGWPPQYAPQSGYGWPPPGSWGPTQHVQPGAGWAYPQPIYGGWGYAPNPWAYQAPPTPWGYGYPPRAEAPGRLHPAVPRKRRHSLTGRAAPRMYAAGWLLTLAGLGAFAAYLAAAYAGAIRGVPVLARASVVEATLVTLAAGLVFAALAQGRQRHADGWLDFFGPSPFLLVLAVFPLALALEYILVGLVDLAGITMATSVETLLSLLLNLVCFVALVHFAVVRPGALSWRDMARPRKLAPDPSDLSLPYEWTSPTDTGGRNVGTLTGDVGLGLALAIPGLIGTLIFSLILATVLGIRDVDLSGPIPTQFPGWDLWITLLATAIVAPIGEEIFFRGFATNAWARSLTRNSAIIRATVFFAFIHIINLVGAVGPGIFVQEAILAVASRIPVAWLLAWIYTRRRSIYASLTLHAVYNGTLVLLVWWVSHSH